jgi:hypothetical protein
MSVSGTLTQASSDSAKIMTSLGFVGLGRTDDQVRSLA